MISIPSHILDWRIRGIPSDIWANFSESIGQLIVKEKLKPIDARTITTPNQASFAMSGLLSQTPELARAKSSAQEIFDIRGGMKALHVHYKGDIYMLNEKQWKSFTNLVIKDFKAKLDAAGAISFDQAVDIAETGQKIGI
jgi:hypothetical protein